MHSQGFPGILASRWHHLHTCRPLNITLANSATQQALLQDEVACLGTPLGTNALRQSLAHACNNEQEAPLLLDMRGLLALVGDYLRTGDGRSGSWQCSGGKTLVVRTIRGKLIHT